MSDDAAREARMRRLAKRQGFHVTKSRERDGYGCPLGDFVSEPKSLRRGRPPTGP
jgi:hypothetical protein